MLECEDGITSVSLALLPLPWRYWCQATPFSVQIADRITYLGCNTNIGSKYQPPWIGKQYTKFGKREKLRRWHQGVKRVKAVIKEIHESVNRWYVNQQEGMEILTPALCYPIQKVMVYAETPAMLMAKLVVVKSTANRYGFCQNNRRIYRMPLRFPPCGSPRFKEFIPNAGSFLALPPRERLLKPVSA